MKKFLLKIKTWFVLRWKEFQSIQRDKKAMKTEREVRKVEFSKKHPVYTIVTRVIAVFAALAVAIGFICVSCKTLKDIEKHSTVTASAETIPEDTSGISAYDLEDVPQFIEIDISSVPFGGVISNNTLYAPVQYFIFPKIQIDIKDCSIYRYLSPYFDDSSVLITSYNSFENISDSSISMWYDDASYRIFTHVFTLNEIVVEFYDLSSPVIDTFYYLSCSWQINPDSSCSFTLSLHGNGGIRHYVYDFNSRTVLGTTFSPYFLYYDSTDANGVLRGTNSQYVYYDYLSKSYYNRGYNEGYDEGFDEGFDEGHSLGLLEGENRGYQIGYAAGDAAGYNRGLSESLGDVTPWDVIVDGVNKFFGLSFFGNSVTIGMIMSIGFGCILFGFAVKIFLGG